MNKRLLTAALVSAVTAGSLWATDPTQLYTFPAVPPRELLERLRLKTAWTAMVPTDGRRDGLFSVQLLPRGTGTELLIQTRSGNVFCYDAETGRLRWSTRVGTAYRVAQPLAYNRESVFVINNIQLYSLDRDTGRMQWDFELPEGAAAPPVADGQQVYLSFTNGRFEAYELPNLALWEKLARQGKAPGSTSMLERARVRKGIDLPAIGPLGGAGKANRTVPIGPQPEQRTSYIPEGKIEGTPLQTEDRIMLTSIGGEMVGVAKGSGREAWVRPLKTRGRIVVASGQHEEMAFVPSTDDNVYAVSISAGRLMWRFPAGGRPSEPPTALQDDVYVPVDGSRMYRVRQADGEELWRNDNATRFLAANDRFVYAADRHGRLVVIDRRRGTTLSTYDGTRDFVVPIANEWTDRVYLAAHNGLIVCLRDRDELTPVVNKKPPKERAPLPPPGGGKPGGGKPGEKPGEKPPKGPADGMKP